MFVFLEVVLFGFSLCGTTLHMKKSDELCKEPEEMKCEGEGIVSGCGYEKGFGDKDDGYEKQSKRQGE